MGGGAELTFHGPDCEIEYDHCKMEYNHREINTNRFKIVYDYCHGKRNSGSQLYLATRNKEIFQPGASSFTITKGEEKKIGEIIKYIPVYWRWKEARAGRTQAESDSGQ